jgi:hypothetical protein
MVNHNIERKHPQMMLMNGNKYFNIRYNKTLDAMNIPSSCIQLIETTIHGVMHIKQEMTLGKSDLW